MWCDDATFEWSTIFSQILRYNWGSGVLLRTKWWKILNFLKWMKYLQSHLWNTLSFSLHKKYLIGPIQNCRLVLILFHFYQPLIKQCNRWIAVDLYWILINQFTMRVDSKVMKSEQNICENALLFEFKLIQFFCHYQALLIKFQILKRS